MSDTEGLIERLSELIVADAFETGRIRDGALAERLIRERIEAAAKITRLTQERDEARGDLRKIRAAIAIKGGDEFSPTQWAYDQACAALDKHRDRAETAKAEVQRLTAALAAETEACRALAQNGGTIELPRNYDAMLKADVFWVGVATARETIAAAIRARLKEKT
jgi:predicted Zn-dependent protease